MTMFSDFLEREIEASQGSDPTLDVLLLDVLRYAGSDKWTDLFELVLRQGPILFNYFAGSKGRYTAFMYQVFSGYYDLLCAVADAGRLHPYGQRELFRGYTLHYANLDNGTSIAVINDPKGRCYRVGYNQQAIDMVRALYNQLVPPAETLSIDDPDEVLDVIVEYSNKLIHFMDTLRREGVTNLC